MVMCTMATGKTINLKDMACLRRQMVMFILASGKMARGMGVEFSRLLMEVCTTGIGKKTGSTVTEYSSTQTALSLTGSIKMTSGRVWGVYKYADDTVTEGEWKDNERMAKQLEKEVTKGGGGGKLLISHFQFFVEDLFRQGWNNPLLSRIFICYEGIILATFLLCILINLLFSFSF